MRKRFTSHEKHLLRVSSTLMLYQGWLLRIQILTFLLLEVSQTLDIRFISSFIKTVSGYYDSGPTRLPWPHVCRGAEPAPSLQPGETLLQVLWGVSMKP